MCRKTMDIKKEELPPGCLTMSYKFGLKLLLHDSAHPDMALRHRRHRVLKSSIRKCVLRERRRAQAAKRSVETGFGRPAGAMAPANTTQYLMGRFYEDFLQDHAKFERFSTCLLQSEERGCAAEDTDTYDACLSFQQRDFEEQFGALW